MFIICHFKPYKIEKLKIKEMILLTRAVPRRRDSGNRVWSLEMSSLISSSVMFLLLLLDIVVVVVVGLVVGLGFNKCL